MACDYIIVVIIHDFVFAVKMGMWYTDKSIAIFTSKT